MERLIAAKVGKVLVASLFLGALIGLAGCKTTNSGSGKSWNWNWPWAKNSTTPVAPDPIFPTTAGYSPQAQRQSQPMLGKPVPVSLAPGTALDWTIESSNQQVPRLTGQAVVGNDGSVIIGPYGHFRVSNMSLDQAANTLEYHLKPYLANPRVSLRPSNAMPASANYQNGEMTWSSNRQVNHVVPPNWQQNFQPVRNTEPQSSRYPWQNVNRYRGGSNNYGNSANMSVGSSRNTDTATSTTQRGPVLRWLFGEN